jgi:hypothetical protein
VSRVADGEAELTEATDATRARRRPWNGRRGLVSGGGATWMCAQGEREGESARLRVKMSRGKWASGVWALKGRGRAEVAGDCANVGASTAGARAGG